ncbi:hypothetical protein [Alkaliphilus hydrothermalis]|uniref:Uncharacterized protein n=1 Tax=Alkaliphilus hydrothermalis TaxID=1482730 RepID=A0ABS2NQ67_9FIRM|nr:hypothetical protein [Alkaliphilus hydrothermalis]MBM7615095.1 hypothetical protein [Alkaliphilus hydrothermalis]
MLVDNRVASQTKIATKVGGKVFAVGAVVTSTGMGVYDNIQNGTDTQRIVTDAVVDATFSAGSVAAGAAIGSVIPVAGTAVGAVVGGVAVVGGSVLASGTFDTVMEKPKAQVKEWVDVAADFYMSSFK